MLTSPYNAGTAPVEPAEVADGTSRALSVAEDAQLMHTIKVAKNFGRRAAHDFNNIMAVIQGFSVILQNRLQNDEANREIAEQIEASSVEALKLTNWLSTFANNRSADLVSLDLNQIIGLGLASLRKEKPAEIDLEVDLVSGPLLMLGDEAQLEQVCRQLWLNAIEAMPEGGTLRWSTARENRSQPTPIDPKENGLTSFLRLRISDTGIGMDQSTQASMFEPFFTTKFGKARGLGLTEVYEVVRSHGGFIQVASQLGVGTTIDVYFPAAQAQSRQKAQKLLVVDDESVIHLLMREILKGQGLEVISAASGEEALDVYQRSREEIGAVILDMTLPRMSGLETFLGLKQLNHQARVIVATGDPYQQAVHDVMAQGAAGVLAKPFRPDHLTDIVKQVLAG
jgi:CheY-like chemotaxis protein